MYLKSMHQEERDQMRAGSVPCFKYIIFAKQKPQLSFCKTEALLVFILQQLLFNTDEQLDLPGLLTYHSDELRQNTNKEVLSLLPI